MSKIFASFVTGKENTPVSDLLDLSLYQAKRQLTEGN